MGVTMSLIIYSTCPVTGVYKEARVTRKPAKRTKMRETKDEEITRMQSSPRRVVNIGQSSVPDGPLNRPREW